MSDKHRDYHRERRTFLRANGATSSDDERAVNLTRCRNPTTDLRQEMRYRRQIFLVDTRPLITVIVVITAALVLATRNDVLLLRGTATLWMVLGFKALHPKCRAILSELPGKIPANNSDD